MSDKATIVDTKNFLVVIDEAKGLHNPNMMSSLDVSINITCPTAPGSIHTRTPSVSGKNPKYNACVLFRCPNSAPSRLKLTCEHGSKHVNIGENSIDLDEVTATNPGQWVTHEVVLGGDKATGTITVHVMEYHCDPVVTIESACNLRNADGRNDLSDAYVILTGLLGPGMVWGQTETVDNHLYPIFKLRNRFIIDLLKKMPAGGLLTVFKVSVMDEDKGKRDDDLGHIIIDWKKLFLGVGSDELKLGDQKLTGSGSLTDTRNAINLVVSLNSEAVKEDAVPSLPVPPEERAVEDTAPSEPVPPQAEEENNSTEPTTEAQQAEEAVPDTVTEE